MEFQKVLITTTKEHLEASTLAARNVWVMSFTDSTSSKSIVATIFNIHNTLARWDERLIDQVSGVPRIFFFMISYRLRALITLYFNFCKIIKNKKIS
jgi:hypothetical protein